MQKEKLFNFFISANQIEEFEWLNKIGGKRVNTLEEAQVILFNGGTDINPIMYGEKRGRYTNISDLKRDKEEVEDYFKAQKLGLICVGVCRGLNVAHVKQGEFRER